MQLCVMHILLHMLVCTDRIMRVGCMTTPGVHAMLACISAKYVSLDL